MGFQPTYDGTSLLLYIGTWGTGRAIAGSHTLDLCTFPVLPGQTSAVLFTAADVGCPISIVGAGPVDPLTPVIYGIQGSTFKTTIAAYVSPTQVTLTAAPPVSFYNSGVLNITVYRLCGTLVDTIKLDQSISPGTRDTLAFTTLQSYDYFTRNQNLNSGQPVYLISSDPASSLSFGGLIDVLTVSNQLAAVTSSGGLPQATNAAGITPFSYYAQCVSWDSIASRRVVQPERASQITQMDAGVVLNTIVVTHLNDEGIAFENDVPPVTSSPYVSGLPLIDVAVPAGAHITDVLNQAVAAANANDPSHLYFWYTDAWRTIHLSERSVVSAPWSVDDTAGSDSNVLVSVSVVNSHNQYANENYVVASAYLGNLVTVNFKGDGATTTFNLPSPAVQIPVILLNATAQTVGIGGVDAGKQWYWNQGSTAITQGTGSVLATSDILAVTFRLSQPATGEAFNFQGLADRVAVEGTGALYQSSLAYSQPIDQTALLQMVEALAAEYGTIPRQIFPTTLRPGLAVGQLQTIKLSDIGVSGEFLISGLTMSTVNNVITWGYTAIDGSNIGNWVTGWANFINRGQVGLNLLTPTLTVQATGGVPTITPGLSSKTSPNAASLALTVTAGNLLIAVLAASDGLLTGAWTVSDTMGNVWSIANIFSNPYPASNIVIFYAVANGSGATTFSFTGGLNSTQIILAQFAGDFTPVVDDSAALNDVLGHAPPVTTTEDYDLLITGIYYSGNSVATVSGTEAILQNILDSGGGPSDRSSALAWGLVPSAGSVTSSLNAVGGGGYGAVWVTVAFKTMQGPIVPPTPPISIPPASTGTVTHTAGALTADLPVFGNSGADIKVGTKTGSTDELVTATGTPGTGKPLIYDGAGNAAPGAVGQLVPAGGTTGQALTKHSGTDYDADWETPSGSGTVTHTGALTANLPVLGNGAADVKPGVTGQLVPAGGSTGQVLEKNSGTDYDASWISLAGGGVSVTTKGDLQGFDTAPNRIPIGADTYVLTADSAQVLGLKWAAAGGGGGGGLVLLESHTASNSAELDFTACISSTYDEYEIHFINILPATNGSTLTIQVSTNGGSSYDTGANYGMDFWEWYRGGATQGGSNSGLTYISPTGGQAIYNVASEGGVVGRVRFYSPASTACRKLFEGRTHFIEQSTGNWWDIDFGGQYFPLTAVNAFRILFSSGHITSGTVRVYGLAK